MSGIIFINYRRADSRHAAGRLYDLLGQEFGREHVFMDVDTIPLGVDFVDYLGAQVGKCQVLVSLIGRQWLEMLRRKAGDPTDFVLVEIAAALKRDIRVFPVLVDGAAMPQEEELPEALKPLARRNAAQLRHESFGADGEKLLRELKIATSEPVRNIMHTDCYCPDDDDEELRELRKKILEKARTSFSGNPSSQMQRGTGEPEK